MSLEFVDIFLQMEAKPVKMRLHLFNSAVIANSKVDYLFTITSVLLSRGSIFFTFSTVTGVKKIVRYTEDGVILLYVKHKKLKRSKANTK